MSTFSDEQINKNAYLENLRQRVAKRIKPIPDYPKPGILFRDINPVLADPDSLSAAIAGLQLLNQHMGVDYVIAAEARGFLFAAALAEHLNAGFVMARKPGKLPGETVFVDYGLEYGEDRLHVSKGCISPGSRVLVHDDLLATGGTAKALCSLVEALGGETVGASFLVELDNLKGREKIPTKVSSLIHY